MSLVDLGKQLLESAKLGETEDVRLLMTNGAPFTTDWLGFSPLHMAAQYGRLSTAEVLLRAGISRDARTKVDRTPLHIAAQEGHAQIVELLITHGAEVDARDMLKMTPLHWATERGHFYVVKVLLENGADCNAMNKFEKTPLELAEDNEDNDLIDLLSQYGATLPLVVKSESVPNKKLSAIKSLTSNVQPSLFTSSSATINNTDSTIKSPTITKPVFLRANLADIQKAASVSSSSRICSSDSEESETTEQGCTNVLATLAALAEATAPNSTISSADALHWLESHGITMLPTDNSTVVASALEGGQTVALTEAGKLALTFVKEQSLNNSSVEVSSLTSDSPEKSSTSPVSSSTNQKVITIVADQSHIPSIISTPQTPIVVLSQPVSSNIVDSTPSVKKIKLSPVKKDDPKIIINGNVTSSSSEEDKTLKLKEELEKIKKQAELYKAQLLQKAHEAELYKRQLEEMRTLPRVNQ